MSSDIVSGVAFKPDNPNILVSCSDDETIKMWDIISGSCLSTLKVDGGLGGVQCVTFNGTGDTIVAGCYNGNIFFIDTATSQVREPPLRGHSGDNPECLCEQASEDNYYEYIANPECPVRGHRYVPSLSRECSLCCFRY